MERDGSGNPREVVYGNGFRVIGKFDDHGVPQDVIIRDDQGNLVFEGIVECDIYQIFQKYLENKEQ